MSRVAFVLLMACGVFVAGCAQESPEVSDAGDQAPSSVTAPVPEMTSAVEDPPTTQDEPTAEGPTLADEPADASAAEPQSANLEPEPQPAAPPSLPEVALDEEGPALTSVPIDSGVVTIGPDNTEIQFVGRHTDDRPDRVGVFQEFAGKIEVDPETQTLTAVSVEVQTESLVTQFDRLTNHLKSPDFFEAREYPTARFQSTAIESERADEEQYRVTGELTLHGVTNPISFPARVRFAGGGLTLVSEFILDRTDFGMNWGPDQVENDVMMTVHVGEKTDLPPAEGR